MKLYHEDPKWFFFEAEASWKSWKGKKIIGEMIV